ncbi:MAG: PDZ domain-containing protein [Pirellulales bacterium]|nr:PDZ domain-containing protein [Pirellulales bacterium]
MASRYSSEYSLYSGMKLIWRSGFWLKSFCLTLALWGGTAAFGQESAITTPTGETVPPATPPAAVTPPAAKLPPSLSPEETAKFHAWVAQLDADEFAAREAAMKNLQQAGADAIPVIAAAIQGNSLEQSHRCLSLLESALVSPNPLEAATAEAALEPMTQRQTNWFAQRAGAAITKSRVLRQKQTIARLQELGAECNILSASELGEIQACEISLRHKDWKGTTEDLQLLRTIPTLLRASFFGPVISDGDIDQLGQLKQVPRLGMYGTKVTLEGLAKLKTQLPNTEIDRRNGAMLGISSDPTATGGCLVNTVQPNSAAMAAGIEPGDLITQIEGTKVDSFQDLTKIVSEKFPGDKIQVTFERNATPQTKEITLGEWKPEHLRNTATGNTIIINGQQQIQVFGGP